MLSTINLLLSLYGLFTLVTGQVYWLKGIVPGLSAKKARRFGFVFLLVYPIDLALSMLKVFRGIEDYLSLGVGLLGLAVALLILRRSIDTTVLEGGKVRTGINGNRHLQITQRSDMVNVGLGVVSFVVALGSLLVVTDAVTEPVFEWTAVWLYILILVVSLVAMIVSLRSFRPLFLPLLGLVVIALPGSLVFFDAGKQVRQAAFHLCQGETITGAGAYFLYEGAHPILLVDQATGKAHFADALPETWTPKRLEHLQLVGCVKEAWEVVETCEYNIGAFSEGAQKVEVQRLQQTLTISVYKALTGEPIIAFTVLGGVPGACPDSVVTVGGRVMEVEDVYGAPVDWLQVQRAIIEIVE